MSAQRLAFFDGDIDWLSEQGFRLRKELESLLLRRIPFLKLSLSS